MKYSTTKSFHTLLLETEQQWRKQVTQEIDRMLERVMKANPDFVKKMRLKYLKTRKRELIKQISNWLVLLAQHNLAHLATFPELDEINRINHEIYNWEHPVWKLGITDEMIERAKNYPISALIKTNKQGFALCPFHKEKTPSFYTKNNFYYCFGCGATGTTIDLYMHLYNTNFKTAVRRLQ